MLFLLIVAGFLSACCGPKMIEVKVVFQNVDPNMGVESYTQEIEIGTGFDLKFVIPEGYTDEGMTATWNKKPLAFTTTDAKTLEKEEHRYTIDKTIAYSFKRLVTDIEIVFDMTSVKKQQFAINFSKDIIEKTKKATEVWGEYDSNITLLTIDEKDVEDLRVLDSDKILKTRTIDAERPSAIVDYGEYIIVCYMSASHREIDSFYSEITDFTPEVNQAQDGALSYAHYDVALRGNQYYNRHYEGFVQSASRLYYIGKIQEDISLQKNVPGYQESKGFVIEDNENKFTILTNQSKYNSDLLSIEVFAPTTDEYVESANMEQVQFSENNETKTVNLKRIDIDFEKSDEGTFVKDDKGNFINDENGLFVELNKGKGVVELKDAENPQYYQQTNSEQVYQYLNRYDAYNIYLGEDKSQDLYLTEREKDLLSDEIYIKVKSSYQLSQILNFNLLQEEKQNVLNNPYSVIYNSKENSDSYKGVNDCVVESYLSEEENVGYKIIRINKALLDEFQDRFVLSNLGVVDGQTVEYQTGNAILYVQAEPSSVDTLRLNHKFLYTEVFCPTFYDSDLYTINHNYNTEVYVNEVVGDDTGLVKLRENRNYGFLDLHGKGADFSYFYTPEVLQVKTDENGPIITSGGYEYIIDSNNRIATYKNINVDIYGKLQDPLYYSKIENLNVLVEGNDPGNEYRYNFQGQEYTGYISMQDIDLYTQKTVTEGPYVKTGYSISVHFDLQQKNLRKANVDFNQLQFIDSYKDAILITNDVAFKDYSSFVVIDEFTKSTAAKDITFGSTSDIYYLIASDHSLDFDFYHKVGEEYVKISEDCLLRDIAGNEIEIEYNNKLYKVYAKYQSVDLYSVDSSSVYYVKKPTN